MSADTVHPLAGKPAPESLLVNVPRLVAAYSVERPDAAMAAQRVAFGTSGHRGSSLQVGFNEPHILAITQAIWFYRRAHGIDGPLFLGWDTHALSEPARVSTFEVLAANGVDVMVGFIDRVAARLGRRLVEMPVGFKYFVDGLPDGSLGTAGEESAGAWFLHPDGAAGTRTRTA